MKDTFSFKRILQILRADLIEYDTYIIFYFLAMLVGQIVLMTYEYDYRSTFNFLLIMVAIGSLRSAGFKVHYSKGMFLTLPASSAEKFFAIVAEILLIFVAYHISFWLAYFIADLLTVHPMFDCSGYYSVPLIWVSIGSFLFTLALFCNMLARKRAFILFLFILFFLLFISAKSTMWLTENAANAIRHFLSEWNTMHLWVNGILFALSGLFLYLSYVQLKRKQLR